MTTESHTDNRELLLSAASLLYVGVAAFRDDGELINGVSLDDVRNVVRTAKSKIAVFVDPNGAVEDVFDALAVLAVVDAALEAGLKPARGGTVSPIRGAMHAAAELLERALGTAEAQEPQDPEPGEGDEAPLVAAAACGILVIRA